MRVARQVISYFKPGHLLFGPDMEGRRQRSDIVECTGIKRELVLVFVSDRRAAAPAMRTLNPGRRGIGNRRALRIAKGTLVDDDEGREGARRMTPTAFAVAMKGLDRGAPIFEPNIAAETAPRSRFILCGVCHVNCPLGCIGEVALYGERDGDVTVKAEALGSGAE